MLKIKDQRAWDSKPYNVYNRIDDIKELADDLRKTIYFFNKVKIQPTQIYNAVACAYGYKSWSDLTVKSEHIKDSYSYYDEDEEISLGKFSKEIGQGLDIDLRDYAEYQAYNLPVSDRPRIKFKGKRLGQAEESPNNAHSFYSGRTGEWTEFEIYQTIKGKYICWRGDYTQWQGCHHTFDAVVCEDKNGVIDFFGHNRLAKKLYAEAGIEDVVLVE